MSCRCASTLWYLHRAGYLLSACNISVVSSVRSLQHLSCVDGVGFGFYRNVDRIANDLLHVNGVASGAGINCRNAKK